MTFTIDRHQGEKTSKSSDKEALNSYALLKNCRPVQDDVVGVGTPVEDFSIENASSITALVTFKKKEVVFFVAQDENGDYQTHLAMNQDGVLTPILDGSDNEVVHNEVRIPSIAITNEVLFYTLGKVVHKIKLEDDQLKKVGTMSGLSEVTAIDTKDNRIFAASGKELWASDQVAGGDCTSFADNDQSEWTAGGQFPTTFDEDLTNIACVGDKIVGFSPNKTEIKNMIKIQETIGSDIFTVKRMEHYGEVEGIGTESIGRIGKYADSLFFIDQEQNILYQLSPYRDQNGSIPLLPIEDNQKNLSRLDLSEASFYFSRKIQGFLIGLKNEDKTLFFNPSNSNWSTYFEWKTSALKERSDGTILIGKVGSGSVFRYDPDLTQNEIVLETNDISPSKFFQKYKVKRLALWLELNHAATVALEKSIDGGEWQEVKINYDIPRKQGAFISPYQVMGQTPISTARREVSSGLSELVKGKIRIFSKGTKIRYRMTVGTANKRFALKYWGIPKDSTLSFRREGVLSSNQT